MSRKILKTEASFSSIFHNAKWLDEIIITGFSSRKTKSNRKLLNSIYKLAEKYNSKGSD